MEAPCRAVLGPGLGFLACMSVTGRTAVKDPQSKIPFKTTLLQAQAHNTHNTHTYHTCYVETQTHLHVMLLFYYCRLSDSAAACRAASLLYAMSQLLNQVTTDVLYRLLQRCEDVSLCRLWVMQCQIC